MTRIVHYHSWLDRRAYEASWLSSSHPIYIGDIILTERDRAFWIGRRVRVRFVDEEDWCVGVINDMNVVDSIATILWSDSAETDEVDLKAYDCCEYDLQYPRVTNREVVDQWAEELWRILSSKSSSFTVSAYDKPNFIESFEMMTEKSLNRS